MSRFQESAEVAVEPVLQLGQGLLTLLGGHEASKTRPADNSGL